MVIRGDARRIPLRDETVQCVVTSPPYFQLRDHQCGEGQIGLEATPEAYIAALVEVFREVWRVLRRDGVLWLVMGDSYWGTNSSQRTSRHPTLKPKDLIGIPWRIALALQADGWYLRADVIWSKPNPMPEPVRDRPTRSHEYVFLLSKGRHYYYDAGAIAEPAVSNHPSASEMKRDWQADELAEQWTLLPVERELLANKCGATRLGFAVLLKFFQCEARFPQSRQEVPLSVVAFLAKQVDVPATC